MVAVCSGVAVCAHTVRVLFMATIFTTTRFYRAVPVAFDLAVGAGELVTLAHAPPGACRAVSVAFDLAVGAREIVTLAHAPTGACRAVLVAFDLTVGARELVTLAHAAPGACRAVPVAFDFDLAVGARSAVRGQTV